MTTAVGDVLGRVLADRVIDSMASVNALLGCLVRRVDCRAPLVSGVPTVSSHVVVISNTPPAATLGSRLLTLLSRAGQIGYDLISALAEICEFTKQLCYHPPSGMVMFRCYLSVCLSVCMYVGLCTSVM